MRNVRFVITLCLFILLGNHLVKAQTVTNPNDREYSLQTPQGIIRGMMMSPGIGEGYPVVLLIAGSGPTDMNGNSMQLGIQPNTLKLIAEGLHPVPRLPPRSFRCVSPSSSTISVSR